MRYFTSLILVIFCTFCLLMHDAQAKRFGGGKSFGVQRSAASSSFARPAAASPASGLLNKSSASKWLGPLAGLAAGGLLASLFMGHGMGTGIMSWLVIAGLAFLAYNLFRSRQPMAAKAPPFASPVQEPNTFTQTANNYSSTGSYPLGFDADGFLRDAKVQFIRLQAAYDQKNLNDIRTFTSPEVYAEIQLQFQERGNADNVTEVTTLNAQLLNASNESRGTSASVKFSGMVREDNQPAAPFDEVWHFERDLSGGSWIVAGIQQA